LGIDGLSGHTRAFLKVQDGCDASCTYCIVPRARGRSRSRDFRAILRELRRFKKRGVKEVVVTGIHLGLYGRDLRPPSSLISLLEKLLGRSSIPRIRLSSLEPLELDEALLALMRHSDRLCPHLHVPLQSGDDGILRRMGRPYDTALYHERIQRAVVEVPDLTVGCDVIVGFPGESAQKFENTLHFLRRLPFTYLHVFPFSARPGTPAASFDERVPPQEVKRRSRLLRKLSGERRSAMMQRYLGRSLPVLLERRYSAEPGWMEGWSTNYLRVRAKGPQAALNQIKQVAMTGTEATHLIGQFS
jgi:threonylcarbamoyladenosine tRNA methylthiotransferase MtaB